MKRSELDAVKHTIKELKEALPPLFPVRVIFRDLKKTNLLGYTELRENIHDEGCHFNIFIDKNLPFQAAWMTVMHEWAHALSWTHGHESVCDHDPEWGLAMSRVYQEIVEP